MYCKELFTGKEAKFKWNLVETSFVKAQFPTVPRYDKQMETP